MSRGRSNLVYCECIFLGNLALKKATVQLTTYFVNVAGLAVDGLPNSQSCTAEHDPDAHPWWSVNLKDAHKIAQVTITSGRGNYTYNYSRARLIHYGQDCRQSAFALCSSKHIKRTISLYSLSSLPPALRKVQAAVFSSVTGNFQVFYRAGATRCTDGGLNLAWRSRSKGISSQERANNCIIFA